MAQVVARAVDAADESEVRRLCGEGAFAHADLLQRAGHVLDPVVWGSELRAAVRGHWHRVDRVAVSLRPSGYTSTCSCGSAGLCRHAGALLLHWIRERASFTEADRSSAVSERDQAAQPLMPRQESPSEEYARFLDRDTLPHLREMARRRQFKGKGRSREELSAQLAALLATPEAVDQGLAMLSEEGRRALDAVHIASFAGPATKAQVQAAYRAMGGDGEVSIEALLDLGLVVSELAPTRSGMLYLVPRAVEVRLPTIGDLIRAIAPGVPITPALGAGVAPRSRLGALELLQAVGQEIGRGGVHRWQPSPVDGLVARFCPTGWRIDPGVGAGMTDARDLIRLRPEARLLPGLPILSDEDTDRLAARTGQTPAAVDFAVQLLADLGIVVGVGSLTLQPERMRELLDLPASARLALLARQWLAMERWTELDAVLGRGGPLQMNLRLSGYGGYPYLSPDMLRARRLVARLVGRMAPDVWCGVPSLLALLARLEPKLLDPGARFFARDEFSISERSGAERARPGGGPVPHDRLREELVLALLEGPLTWLGLVDVAFQGRTPVFRVLPEAGVLTGRPVPERPATERASLAVSRDLTVAVAAGSADTEIHRLLAGAGELIDASPEGRRYRLTLERTRELFDAGTTGPELIRALSERAGGDLPAEARATLERWWTSYGEVRMYDDLTLIELADDYLLPELLATTSLRSSLIHTLSPRLIAVESRAAEQLIAEMVRIGHMPRVVGEA